MPKNDDNKRVLIAGRVSAEHLKEFQAISIYYQDKLNEVFEKAGLTVDKKISDREILEFCINQTYKNIVSENIDFLKGLN